ncbi:MAG TPA: hypothetical protein P5071_00635 [Paludibacteraceae bacterium]|nr:hypothetical protein [Paludibacteraceae bacterium]HPC26430.1 hypothetical protein [Paludibacteraceae bacterium]HRR62326.1 hypothetical protein [Paludibacteraceae bacterium]HRU63727.1 hypothetical protein [Paludibacteraceae bacterium]
MNEMQVKLKAEKIIEALTALSLGKNPNIFSGEIFRKLADHPNFIAIRDAYIEYLKNFTGEINTQEDVKRLFDFRMKIVELFSQE